MHASQLAVNLLLISAFLGGMASVLLFTRRPTR
jgi:hypothetical protein